MKGVETGIMSQERRPELIPEAAHVWREVKANEATQPRFPRLMRALEEARLTEQVEQHVLPPQMPRFRILESAIAAQQLATSLGPTAACAAGGAGDVSPSSRSWWRSVPACSVALLAGAAVAIGGASFMARVAANSPAETEAETSAMLLGMEDDQPGLLGKVMLSYLREPPAARPVMVNQTGRQLPIEPAAGLDPQSDNPPRLWSGSTSGLAAVPVEALIAPQAKTNLSAHSKGGGARLAVMAAHAQPGSREGPTAPPADVLTRGEEPSSFPTAYEQGYALQQQKRYEEALANYVVALKLDPTASHILYNMGAVLSELGRLDEAAAAFARSVALNESNPFAFYDWGWVLERAGSIDEAIDKYRQAIAADALSHAGINAQKRLTLLQP